MSSIKLSPGLKSLLALPSAKPSPLPSPGRQALYRLFDSIRQDLPSGSTSTQSQSQSSIGKNAWLTVGTAAVCTINSPEALCQLWEYARDAGGSPGGASGGKAGHESGNGNGAWEAGVMREVGLKCISFNGIPRTINCLGALRSHLPEEVKAQLDTRAYRQPTPSNITAIQTRSRALWDSIYAPHHNKLISKLTDSHPDLPVHILSSHYGPLLADPEDLPSSTSIGRILTSIVAMTCLRAQRGVGPQVTSHVFGLLKASLEKDQGVLDEVEGGEWLCSEEGARWVLESTDRVGEVLAGGKTSFAGPPGEDGEVRAKL